jgi:two-component system, chemotaxis family, CheB/CheR fusion protein
MIREVEWPTGNGEFRCLDVELAPLSDVNGAWIGASLTFPDVTLYRTLQEELQHANQELETTMEELQSTNEELETTNEELQSTVEELETTNEELQSTNEELETMNEELQSTNQELTAINDELGRRSEEVSELNDFLEAVLASLRGGAVVVDKDLHITRWNREAQNLWGLHDQEVRGKSLLNLDIGLPTDDLIPPLRACLSGETTVAPVRLESTNRRGKAITCKVTLMPLLLPTNDGQADVQGAILIMEEE